MLPENPTLSVCVTTYQHASYIGQCLRSVLSQSFEGTLELLVGDDGSVDGARDVIEAMAREDGRIRNFDHSVKLGPAGNLRFLVSEARGQFIAHLDGDDFWLPGKIAAQLATFGADFEVVAVYSNAEVVDGGGHRLGVFNRDIPDRINLQGLLQRGNFLNHSSLVYRATARGAVLEMDESFIDYRLHLRLLRHGALAYLSEAFVGYRWRTGSSMIRTMPSAVCEGHLDAFHEAVALGATGDDLQDAISRFWGKVMVQNLLAGRWAQTRIWARLLVEDPMLHFSQLRLLKASLLALPRAFASWWRRRHRTKVIFFP